MSRVENKEEEALEKEIKSDAVVGLTTAPPSVQPPAPPAALAQVKAPLPSVCKKYPAVSELGQV